MSQAAEAHEEAPEHGMGVDVAGVGAAAVMDVDEPPEEASQPWAMHWHRIGNAEMQVVRDVMQTAQDGDSDDPRALPQLESGRPKRRRVKPDRLEPAEKLKDQVKHPDSHFKEGSLRRYVHLFLPHQAAADSAGLQEGGVGS